MIVFRKPLEGVERPVMEADVVIVGGGPAGMACALRLSQLIDDHNAKHPDAPLTKENIYLLEKAREVGAHCLSGALLDPRSMRELLPGFEKEAPLDAAVVKEAVSFLSCTGKFKFPITPPAMRDHGNYVISINKFVKWLGSKVEEAGITVFTGFAGSELLFDSGRVVGVRTDDKGVDKNGERKSNFEPGYDLKAKVVILAEGTRGSLTILLVTQSLLGISAGSLAILVATHHATFAAILVVAIVFGATDAADLPTRQALVADLVERHLVVNAVALGAAAMSATRIVGPSVAGLLIGFAGPAVCFGFLAVAYLAPIVVLLTVIPDVAPLPRQAGATAWSELIAGLRVAGADPLIRGVVIVASVLAFCGVSYMPFLPVLAKTELHVGPQALGIMYSVGGIGGLVGGLAIASLGGGGGGPPPMLARRAPSCLNS